MDIYMTDLPTAIDQLNGLKSQLMTASSLSCCCCAKMKAVQNGLYLCDAILNLDDVDMIMTGKEPPSCEKCTQMDILIPQYNAQQKIVYDLINITYSVTSNPFIVKPIGDDM